MRIIPGGVIKPAMGTPETIRVPVTVIEPAEFAEDPDHIIVIPVCRQDRRSGLLRKLLFGSVVGNTGAISVSRCPYYTVMVRLNLPACSLVNRIFFASRQSPHIIGNMA